MCWAIWMVHNEFIFRNIQPSLQGCKDHFIREFALVILRSKRHLPELMSLWIDNSTVEQSFSTGRIAGLVPVMRPVPSSRY
ncbi:hypothetical protein HU200_046970 [Digitaria exilis]|uniref:Uncharacterized protein n=1 Tax=Digitaria exilis TaxID=1010633 RepID=A0A835B390_9POAL|nr:hypothetical protein HU200_046970 [Digitaria exilis]